VFGTGKILGIYLTFAVVALHRAPRVERHNAISGMRTDAGSGRGEDEGRKMPVNG
jgi:hypothetical protein